MKKLGALWTGAGEKTKKKYLDLAAKAKVKFNEERAAAAEEN